MTNRIILIRQKLCQLLLKKIEKEKGSAGPLEGYDSVATLSFLDWNNVKRQCRFQNVSHTFTFEHVVTQEEEMPAVMCTRL